MQNYRDYYQILGVANQATSEEIKRVYRRLARQYHPDMNPGNKEAEEKFKDIVEAYEVLSDNNRRKQYDDFSKYWQRKNKKKKSGPNFNLGNWSDRFIPDTNNNDDDLDYSQFRDFNSFFDQILGGGRRKKRVVNDDDDFNPRGRGKTQDDDFNAGNTKRAYTVNNRITPQDVEAELTLPLEKAFLGGEERIRLEDGTTIEIDLPSGLITDQVVRLKGQGIDGGDLYLKVTVAPHPFLQLEGLDIYCQIPITPSEAILGGQIQVPTLDGLVKMNLPGGISSGKILRMANKGYYQEDGSRGDQLVEIKIVVSKEITPEEKELYQKLRKIETFNPRENLMSE